MMSSRFASAFASRLVRPAPPARQLAASARLGELTRQYGAAAIGTYLGLSFSCVGLTFFSIQKGTNVEELMRGLPLPSVFKDGMISHKPKEGGDDFMTRMVKDSGLVAKGSTLLIAMAFCKLLIPIKLPMTAALTPLVARLLARIRGVA